MLAGEKIKTNSYTLIVWWESDGPGRDSTLAGQVCTWIAQNERVLNKKRANEVVKLMAEQFPWLKEIEAQHVQLQWARLHA